MDLFFIGHQLMQILFLLLFGLSFIMVLISMFRNLKQWNHNNHSPRLTVEAAVVEKRMQVRRRRSGNNMHHRTYTEYYATFQFESGDRLELELTDSDAGLIVEGDRGKLTFQGTRFLAFQREF